MFQASLQVTHRSPG